MPRPYGIYSLGAFLLIAYATMFLMVLDNHHVDPRFGLGATVWTAVLGYMWSKRRGRSGARGVVVGGGAGLFLFMAAAFLGGVLTRLAAG